MVKKTTYILIDVSGSMHDCSEHSRASAVNEAMQRVMGEILPRVLAEKDAEFEPSIAVLTFSSEGIEWHIEKTRMEDVAGDWMPIEDSRFSGGTPTGAAIKTVIESIKNGTYGEPDPEEVAPAFLLISDGAPNGIGPSYEEALGYADRNNPDYSPAFRHSNRIAIGIQTDADGKASLEKFGRVSRSIAAKGYTPYYDCTDDNTQELIDIIMSCTMALSTEA